MKLIKATITGDYNLINSGKLKKSLDNKEDIVPAD